MAVLKAAFGDTPIMIEYDDFIKNLGHFKKKKKSHPTILLSCALSLNSELHAVTLIEGCVQGAWTAHSISSTSPNPRFGGFGGSIPACQSVLEEDTECRKSS